MSATLLEVPQHMTALAKANETRTRICEIKAEVKEGRRITEALLEHPVLARQTVGQVLRYQRGWGGTKVEKFCRAIPISSGKAVGTLTERQRHVIADGLRGLW